MTLRELYTRFVEYNPWMVYVLPVWFVFFAGVMVGKAIYG